MLIGTQNCRGLHLENDKVLNLKLMLDKEKIDILFLQETHVDNVKLAKSIENKLDGKLFWSLGSNNARGVGIYFNKHLDVHVHKFITDPFGRFLIIDANVEGDVIRLVNVYAPNDGTERKTFYTDLYPYFVIPKPIIFGGDLNCVKDTSIDKINGNPNKGMVGWAELSILTRDSNLIDIYRHKFPNKRTVSWTDGIRACLLDRLFMPRNLADKIQDVCLVPTTFSDHDLFKVKLSPLSLKVTAGEGYLIHVILC